ncbi:redoxin domain-containing protein [Salegentibacter sp. BDJ18]|uniref:redoxin domain-containing protein n=1 Tax=Salegentibacter sp. BDJ18 TaxID=2816376 RepID=UPI001AAE21D0|nr:redoxin domain-containing protein [Salegentibacter sp. BDJ18]MBO2544981.1 redoxin domain-containing protein [Salegentibacter sp. BDJ18]
MKNVLPRKEVPRLRVETTSGMQWDIRDQKPENFTMVIFYRGLHCPVCKSYLEELNKKVEKFQEKGVSVICLSANNKSLAEKTVKEWEVYNLTIGYNFNPEDARKWDLYISEGINDEPEVFFEPGLFLVKPDNTLYAASIQTMPFARPKFDELLKAIDFVVDKEYPARGEA